MLYINFRQNEEFNPCYKRTKFLHILIVKVNPDGWRLLACRMVTWLYLPQDWKFDGNEPIATQGLGARDETFAWDAEFSR